MSADTAFALRCCVLFCSMHAQLHELASMAKSSAAMASCDEQALDLLENSYYCLDTTASGDGVVYGPFTAAQLREAHYEGELAEGGPVHIRRGT